ncbi:MAG: hypothetical protein GXO06_04055 [Epsilonproteobacteria bacterium]|nr:hypothetical protein [Campylobacterota bacterium]
MDFILQRGFFGTNSPFFIDFSITIFTLLPIFMAGAIFLARREFIKHHIIIQISLFVLVSSTLLIDIYSFSQVDIELKNGIIFYSYIIFIFSLYTVWYRTVYFSIEDSKRKALPGLYSKAHKRAGNILMVLIGINPILGMITYYLSFII